MLRLGYVLGASLLMIIAAGCSQATVATTANGPLDPLSGKIVGLNFSLKSATVAEVTTGYYTVFIWGQNASAGVGPANPTYPYLQFRLAKTSGTQTYAVTTFGAAADNKPGIQVTAWTSPTAGTWFDSGELWISKIDVPGKVISGELRNLATTEGTSALNGSFTATIP